MIKIFSKELKAYLGSYSTYLVVSFYIIFTALSLWFFENEFNAFNSGNASLSSFFFLSPWAFLLLIPAITMKHFAEEKQLGTLQWLFSQPVKKWNIVLGKYFSSIVIIAFMLLCTVVFIYTLQYFSLNGNLDYGTIFSGYLGLFLLGCLFAAIGTFASAITSNQVVSYVVSVFLCFILYYGFSGLASYNLLGGMDYYLQQLGAEFHYNSFLKGIIDSRDLFYFITLIGFFLTLSYLIIKRN